MFQDIPHHKPIRHPNSLVLRVTLRGAPERRRRRAFFHRMHQEARRLGVVLSQRLGLCVLLGAERMCTTASRRGIVVWLIEQPDVAGIAVDRLGHLGDLFDSSSTAAERGESLSPDEAENARALVRRVAIGAINQWIGYTTGLVA